MFLNLADIQRTTKSSFGSITLRTKSTCISKNLFWCFRLSPIGDSCQVLIGPSRYWLELTKLKHQKGSWKHFLYLEGVCLYCQSTYFNKHNQKVVFFFSFQNVLSKANVWILNAGVHFPSPQLTMQCLDRVLSSW